MFDGKAFGEEMVGIVKTYVDRATAPLLERIAVLEARGPEKGEDGKSVEPDEVERMIAAAVTSAVAQIPAPQDGKSVELDDLRPVIAAEVARATDGKGIAAEEITLLITEAVGVAVKGTPPAKDGVGLAGALIDRAGSLVLTLTDGTTRDLGPVVGKDADLAGLEQMIRDTVASIPAPKDGADGLGFDDLAFEHDGERGFVLRFAKGERTKEFSFEVPMVLDRGVYRAEQAYSKGDAVSWAGSLWIAQKGTTAKPDGGDDWRLAVKRGRDGKDGGKA